MLRLKRCEYKKIGDAAFGACMHLQNINLPDSIEYIGINAFLMDYRLGNLVLPTNLKYIYTIPLSIHSLLINFIFQVI